MEEIFLALNKQRRVSPLSIRRSQVGHLPTSLFVRAVLQLKEVDLGLTNMFSDQVSNSQYVLSRLKNITYQYRGSTKNNKDHLMGIKLTITIKTFLQLSVLCAALPHTRSLQKLDITGLCLSQLEPRLLAEGLARLTEVTIISYFQKFKKRIFARLGAEIVTKQWSRKGRQRIPIYI